VSQWYGSSVPTTVCGISLLYPTTAAQVVTRTTIITMLRWT